MNQPHDNRHLLLVVGMHRSGTSALCAALAACGASFGDHLLGAMAGVNDEGFWEDADVVAINDQLLSLLDASWYRVSDALAAVDWQADMFHEQRQCAAQVLARRFGDGPLEAVKDPRLCLTLPFWLTACAAQDITTTVIVSSRSPLEVARSLQKRDAFPLALGLRLYASYQQLLAGHAPEAAIHVTYDQLLQDPAGLMNRLARDLPLSVDLDALRDAVRPDLRHQHNGEEVEESERADLLAADSGDLDPAALWRLIDEAYPLQRALDDTVSALAGRGEALTRIGEEHSVTLATLNQRDAEIGTLGAEHKKALATLRERDAEMDALAGEHERALATIDERDEQIREFDRRLSRLGEEHSYALELIQSRDEQLQRVFAKPGIGYLFRAMWKHESR